MKIVAIGPNEHERIAQMAEVLIGAFEAHSPDSWPDMESAVEEVASALAPGKVCLAALEDEGNTVLGWIAGQPEYSRVWELHPLAVRPKNQRKGVGRALVAELEARVRRLGCLTLRLGTDDEDNQTSLSGADLYTDIWEKIRTIQNPGAHPYAFYQRCGYAIVGVIPDANGLGKPDILMAKRL